MTVFISDTYKQYFAWMYNGEEKRTVFRVSVNQVIEDYNNKVKMCYKKDEYMNIGRDVIILKREEGEDEANS